MSNHAELFNGLLEAGKALEELPQVKAQLSKVEDERDDVLIRNMEMEAELSKRSNELAELNDKLSTREAELASATFRAKQSADMLDNLRGLLGVQSTPVGDHTSPVAGEAETNGWAGAAAAPLSGPDSPATTYGVVDEGQFISYDPEEPKSVPEIAQDSFKASMEPQPKPYADRPHWQKPSAMSWEEWTEKGGDTPYWWPKEAGHAAF
jgi:hypothetical protein